MNHALLPTIGWLLVHSLWQFALIGGLAWFLDRCLPTRSSSLRYYTLLAALLLMAVTPLATGILLTPPASEPTLAVSPEKVRPLATTDQPGLALPPATSPTATFMETTPMAPANPARPPMQPEARHLTMSTPDFVDRLQPLVTWMEPWMSVIACLWLTGILFFATRFSMGWLRIHQLVRDSKPVTEERTLALLKAAANRLAIHRRLKLVCCPAIQSPVVVGILRATVIVPTGFASGISPDLIEAIFAHELAHVKRLDFLINLVQSMVDSLYFYHPVVWWLSRRIREERENCCDDIAAAAMCSPITVGRALLMLEENRDARVTPAMGSDGGQLAVRIRRLVNPPHSRRKVGGPVPLLAAGFLMLLFVGITGMLVSGNAASTIPPATESYTVRFDGDKSVGLIAVRAHRSDPAQIWNADGSSFDTLPSLPEVPTNSLDLASAHELFFQCRGLADRPHPVIKGEGVHTVWNPTPDSVSIVMVSADPPAQMAQISMDIPSDQWGPWQAVDDKGQVVDRAAISPAMDQVYNALRIKDIQWSDDRASVRWAHRRNVADLAIMEIVAVLKNGDRERPSGRSLWDDAQGITRDLDLFSIASDQLDHFEYRLCPIQYRLEFQNISLDPQQKTDVQLRVKRIPESTVDLPPTMPNELLPEHRIVYGLRFDGNDAITSVAYGSGEDRSDSYPRVRRWQRTTGKMIDEVPLNWEDDWTRYNSQLFLTADRQRVFGSLGDSLGGWDATTGELLQRMKPQWNDFGDLTLRFVTATSSGRRVACAGLSNSTQLMQDGIIYIWNGQTGELVREIRLKASGYVQSLALSDDGTRVAAWPAPGGVGIWDTETGESLMSFANRNPEGSWPEKPLNPSVPDQVLGLQFSHDGQTLAIGDLVGVKLIDTKTGKLRRSIRAPFHYNSPEFVFSPDDRWLLRYGAFWKNRHESLLWQVDSGEPVAMLPIQGSAAAFSADGQHLAIGRSDRQRAIAVWDFVSLSSKNSSASPDVTSDEKTVKDDTDQGNTNNHPSISQQVPEVDRPNVDPTEEIRWSPHSKENWTTGIQVIQMPTGADPVLVVQYVLRNEAATRRTVDLSFSSGTVQYTVDSDRNIESWIAQSLQNDQFEVEAGEVLSDPRFQQSYDLKGLESAAYQVRLRYGFSLPAGQPGTRHGIPFDDKIPIRLPDAGRDPSDSDQAPPTFSRATDVDLEAVRWGQPVGGLRLGMSWKSVESGTFHHGQLASAQLLVQNVTEQVIECQLSLPHSMDGWGYTIRNSNQKHMPRKQTFFTGFDPRRDLKKQLQPGEVCRVTGEPSQFVPVNSDDPQRADVRPLQFNVAESLPESSEFQPPYTYGLKPGDYTIESYMRVQRPESPTATFLLRTRAEFQVVPSP